MNYWIAMNLLKEMGPQYVNGGFRWLLAARKFKPVKSESEWCDEYDQKWKKPPDIQVETTYERCVDVRVSENAEFMVFEVSLWHGNMCGGERDYRRGKSSVYRLYLDYLPDEFKKFFEEILEDLATQQIEKEEDDEKHRCIQNRMAVLSERFEN